MPNHHMCFGLIRVVAPPATASGCPEQAHRPAERGAVHARASHSYFNFG